MPTVVALAARQGQLEVHHLTALKEGGSNDLTNLESLCRDCHIKVHTPNDNYKYVSAEWRDMVKDLLSGLT